MGGTPSRAMQPPRLDLGGWRWAAALALVVALGLGLRLQRALSEPPIPDETICTGIAERVFAPDQPLPRHGGDHPALGIYLLAASGGVFGRSPEGYRIGSALAGAITLIAVALAVRASASAAEALVASLILAVDGLHVDLTARAFEMGYQILFVSLAWLALTRLRAGGGRWLIAAGALLGLAFMCNESATLVGLAWGVVLLGSSAWRGRFSRRQAWLAAGAFLLTISPDIAYNLTATRIDYRYVNYSDHLVRIGRLEPQLQGVGFFLRDAFNAIATRHDATWSDGRCEYAGHGVVLGALLLAGWLHSLGGRRGDPSGGLWWAPPTALVLATSLLGPIGSTDLERPIWTWPAPALPLVAAATARLAVACWSRAWPVLLLVALLALLPGPAPRIPCGSGPGDLRDVMRITMPGETKIVTDVMDVRRRGEHNIDVGGREMKLVLDGELSLDAARARAKRAVMLGEASGVVTVTDGTRILYQCWGDGADFYELQYEIEQSRRRSPRLAVPIPVEIAWGEGVHGARTADVSYHGAKILCTSICPPDTQVDVKNLESGASARFRVVWIADHEADVSWAYKLGLEFTDDLSPGFWGAGYQRQAREV